MGLLDILGNLSEEKRFALMGAAANMLSGAPGQRKNFGADLGHGLMGGLQAYQGARSAKSREEEEKQQREMRAMQMAQMQRQEQDQMDMRSLAQRSFGPNPNPMNFQGQPMGDDEGNALPQAPGGGGMPEFAKGMMGIDPRMALSMMPKPQGPVSLGEGARLVDPVTGREITSNPKPQGPKKGETREVKTGGNIITYEHNGERWEKIGSTPQFKPDGPEKPDKAPPGYRWAGGNLEAIPGGPADRKIDKEADAAKKRIDGAVTTAQVTLGSVRDAINSAGFGTTGATGAVMRNVPGSKAMDLAETLKTVKANIGFDKLQEMREASPTGGALGQVAVQELAMLQAVRGSLEQAQSQDQLLKSLYAIEKHYQNWLRIMEQAKGESQGAGGFKYLGKEGG